MILGYIYVILGVIAGSTKGGVSKLLSGSVKSSADNLFVNAVRMLLCTCIGFVAVIVTGNGFAVTWEGLLISLLYHITLDFSTVIISKKWKKYLLFCLFMLYLLHKIKILFFRW